MSSSESDGEHYETDRENRRGVDSEVQSFLSMKPEYVNNRPITKNAQNSSSFRSQLKKFKSSTNPKKSSRLDKKKEMEEYFRDLSSDFHSLAKKFDTIIGCISELYDKMDNYEKRLEKLESPGNLSQPSRSYAAQAALPPPDETRLDKLEFATSEHERKSRMLEVSLTHPDIDQNNENLNEHIKSFFVEKLKMENRTIDTDFSVKKLPRNNTVMVTFSEMKFKRFLFSARKKIFQLGQPSSELYVNENLTTYNFKMLKTLKMEKKRRSDENLPGFDSVYSFDGKVFVKKVRNTDRSSAIHISNPKQLSEFVESLTNESTTGANGL